MELTLGSEAPARRQPAQEAPRSMRSVPRKLRFNDRSIHGSAAPATCMVEERQAEPETRSNMSPHGREQSSSHTLRSLPDRWASERFLDSERTERRERREYARTPSRNTAQGPRDHR